MEVSYLGKYIFSVVVDVRFCKHYVVKKKEKKRFIRSQFKKVRIVNQLGKMEYKDIENTDTLTSNLIP